MTDIAVLEDDAQHAELLQYWLESDGHKVVVEHHPEAFIKLLDRERFGLLVLDWRLPEMSGLKTLEQLRARHGELPSVVFLTANDSEESVVAALDTGADDYIVKPIRRPVFLARIRAVLRRAAGAQSSDSALEFPPYHFNRARMTVNFHDEHERLTTREFELAIYLFRHHGQLLSRGHLLQTVWGVNVEVQTRTLDTHISRLRQKLQLDESNGWVLNSVYGYGYRLEPSASS